VTTTVVRYPTTGILNTSPRTDRHRLDETPRCERDIALTIEELLAGAEPKIPPMRATFERAQWLRSASQHRQAGLFGD
jgi:hypothetical protein